MSYLQQANPYQAPTGEPPLWAPYYGATFGAAIRRFFTKYAVFNGRASRSEYWWSVLALTITDFLVLIIASLLSALGSTVSEYGTSTPGPGGIVGLILMFAYYAAIIVPSIALTVRRLHDGNLSGFMILLGLIPGFGGIIILVFSLLSPNPAGQRFDQPGIG
ncbi:DUF805 domain-containing protein [Paenarthrobacter sp. NPDC018779]|uniref:DUF805 domain-containing protein n=1 Tax=Paenarthrobacter sp. NPDC018779 TaxID=3364375 RepID=UPI0037CC13C2